MDRICKIAYIIAMLNAANDETIDETYQLLLNRI